MRDPTAIEELEAAGEPGADDNSLDFDAQTLEAVERFVSIKTVAYKTVDTFAGLTKKRLWLRNAATAGTDGNEIRAPFTAPAFYRQVEEQLAHVLFRTDARAKRLFVEEYAGNVQKIAKQRGVEISKAQLAPALAYTITVLERHRVRGLWGLLYEGSSAIMRETDAAGTRPLLPEAHESVLGLLTCLATLPQEVEKGKLERFRPYVEEALRKVSRRGFDATLAVTKWLVMQLVNEIIREAKDMPPPPPPEATSFAGGGGAGAGGEDEEDEKDGDDSQGENRAEAQATNKGEGPEKDGEGGDGEEKQAGGEDDGEGKGGGQDRPQPWNPPAPEASAEDRAKALKELLDKLGHPPLKGPPDSVTESQFQRSNAKSSAASNRAINSPVNSPEKFEQQLQDSEGEMNELLKQARAALRQKFHEDDWLQKNAMAKIVFVDEPRPKEVVKLAYEDEQTVRRLRALFHRVMGKRKTMLADSGIEIDVPALIEHRLSGQAVPVFREDVRGRGFRAHLLVDLSGSMAGPKLQQCERAANIIKKALAFPFVSFETWGFTSHEAGEAKLTRFDPKGDIRLSMEMRGAGGFTPVHIAVRVAARKLQESHDDRQLFVLTDGLPVHKRRDGRQFSTRQLTLFFRDEVRDARKSGTNVTGVLLGNGPHFDLEDRDLFFIFGGRRNWRKMTGERFGNDLVQLVSTSFLEFLSRR
jgi:hypothetical protein